ncbi:MAG: DUF5916 domain-containing protein, partial [Bacteroidota bacterium]
FLYTRRIGRAPQRGGFVPASAFDAAGETGTVYTDRPSQTTILGAAKMTGRVGAFQVGMLNAVTGEEFGEYAVVDGINSGETRGQELIEPATNYLVSRGRGRVGRTQVGGLVTAVNRAQGNPDVAALLPSQEYVAGVDFEHALSDAWVFSGLAAASRVAGTSESILLQQTAFRRLYQRPDASHLAVDSSRTALTGTTAELAISKVTGTHWRGSFSAAYTSPGFETNALGFQTRADQGYLGASVFYDRPNAGGPFQRWTANLFGSLGWSMGGDRTHSFIGWGVGADFESFWSASLTGFASIRTVNDRFTRGGPLMTDPVQAQAMLRVNTDQRKLTAGSMYVHGSADEIGGGFWGGGASLRLRPRPNVSVSVGPDYTRSYTQHQFVTAFDDPAAVSTFGRRYIFGNILRHDLFVQTRIDWTFSPTVTLQVFARPLISTGRYRDFRALQRPGQMALPVYGAEVGTVQPLEDGAVRIDPEDGGEPFDIGSQDFTFRALQGNAVLRWEYRPGSTLFLVWQQQRDGFFLNQGRLRGRDLTGLFTDVGQNVFLVKLSFWLAR